jgi:integrase
VTSRLVIDNVNDFSAHPAGGLVFTREDGSGLHPGYVTRHIERLAKDAGLPPIRLHDLRHGAATLALAGGADLKTESEMLGHSPITITADTYASELPEVAHRAAEAAARLVPRSKPAESVRPGPISAPSGPENDDGRPPARTKGQVMGVRREGLEPPTR